MIKWSRVRLVFSILSCEGLFATLRERIQNGPAQITPRPNRPEAALGLPRYYDYAGVLHIHSTYSDGIGTVSEIAKAANDAGLDFCVLCDHSNLQARTDQQDGWRGRTLMLVGTEITTDTGHLLALNVPTNFVPASGNAREAQAAILASGGVGFVALPCDLKDHWRNFEARLPGIGLEVFNLSAIARTKINLPALILIWLRYQSSRRDRAFHLVAARPAREMRLWDQLTMPSAPTERATPIVGIASLDAHAVMRFGGRDYPYPTYEEIFRTLRTHIVTRQPLTHQNAETDSAQIYTALREGRCYLAYDNYADPTGFVFEAVPCEAEALPVTQGEEALLPDHQWRFIVQAPRTRSLVRLYRNGRLVAAARGGRLEYQATLPGVYRAEVYLYWKRIGSLCLGARPWIFSNPIYVQPFALPAPSLALRQEGNSPLSNTAPDRA